MWLRSTGDHLSGPPRSDSGRTASSSRRLLLQPVLIRLGRIKKASLVPSRESKAIRVMVSLQYRWISATTFFFFPFLPSPHPSHSSPSFLPCFSLGRNGHPSPTLSKVFLLPWPIYELNVIDSEFGRKIFIQNGSAWSRPSKFAILFFHLSWIPDDDRLICKLMEQCKTTTL